MPSICFWLFLIFVSAVSSDYVGVTNNYVDKKINEWKNRKDVIDQIDPLKAPDFEEGNFQGRNVWIRGLSSFYRSGDCLLIRNNQDYMLKVNIAANNITVNMNYKYNLGITLTGTIEASLDTVAVFSHINFVMNKAMLELQEFKVTKFGTIHINKITGPNIFKNSFLNIAANIVAKFSKHKIIQMIEANGSELIAKYIHKMNFPVLNYIINQNASFSSVFSNN